MRKEKYNKLIQERDELRVTMAETFADNKFKEYDRLCCRLQKLDEKIRKEQK